MARCCPTGGNYRLPCYYTFPIPLSYFEEGIKKYGMDVSNHSYALNRNGNYDTSARRIDQLVRGDATNNNQTIPARPVFMQQATVEIPRNTVIRKDISRWVRWEKT